MPHPDHSDTYRSKTVRNSVHRIRLKQIFRILDGIAMEGKTYADFGCSSGYVTSLITERYNPRIACGFDSCAENIALAQTRYPRIFFEHRDLNEIADTGQRFDIVSCFEVLEHLGSIPNGIHNLLNAITDDGILIISVPIESGPIGFLKFLLKTLVYRDKLDELPGKRFLYLRYLYALACSRDISRFRDPREQWGTHFGFEYRLVDRFLDDEDLIYKASSKCTTRFYIVRACGEGRGLAARKLVCDLPKTRFRPSGRSVGQVPEGSRPSRELG